MRTARIVILLATCFSCMLGTGLVQGGSTPEYLGEFCWEADGGPDYLRLGFTHMGDGYFNINGGLHETAGNVNLMHGTGCMVGNDLHIHMSTSGIYTTDVVGFIGTIILDINTLNGQAEGVGVHADRGTSQTGMSYDGIMTLTFIPCP
jgi:hypothetical protein